MKVKKAVSGGGPTPTVREWAGGPALLYDCQTYWKQPWYATLSQKPRFTYENGKCSDYTDCYCSGCGTTFKNDATKGEHALHPPQAGPRPDT